MLEIQNILIPSLLQNGVILKVGISSSRSLLPLQTMPGDMEHLSHEDFWSHILDLKLDSYNTITICFLQKSSDEFSRGVIFDSIGEEVWMSVSEDEKT